MAVDLKTLTSKKVAGIPVIYIVLVLAAAALYGAIRMPKREDAPEEQAEELDYASEPGGDIEGAVQQPVFIANPAVAVSGVPDTNELWGRRAVEWLIGSGASVSAASTAITKYLEGETLSYDEGVLRDKAVKNFGIPPEGIIATSTAPKPATPTPGGYKGPGSRQGVPPTTHTVTGKSDDQWLELTRLYYNRTGEPAIRLLIAANPNLKKPFPKGTRVHIPAFHEPVYYRTTSATRTLHAIAQKNGTTPVKVRLLNPGFAWPARIGARVRVK